MAKRPLPPTSTPATADLRVPASGRVTGADTRALDGRRSVAAAVARQHPRYSEWQPIWRNLAHVYEGDGPYLTGDALVPHARELVYAKGADGTTNFNSVIGVRRKYTQRQQIARYENFSEAVVGLYVDYQYAKLPSRSWGDEEEGGEEDAQKTPLQAWHEDVDGFGTHIDDWLKRYQVLTDVFGHMFVLMDRLPPNTRTMSVTARGQKTQPTLADLGRPVLRIYSPLDAPDWLAPQNQLSAVKFQESIERKTLLQTVVPTDKAFFFWDREQWSVYNARGEQLKQGQHGFGQLPVTIWYAKRRAILPIIGRGLLGDGSLAKDHYNLISELRELFRAQVFSMLHIQLGNEETIQQARENLGDHAGTDAIVFSKGGANFIAPPDGPAARYTEEISNVERKIYRLASLPWETDSKDAEAEGSRKLKAADLNASLSSLADNAQELDYWIARMFYAGTYGAVRGKAAYEESKYRTEHPDDFNVQELMERAEEVQTVVEMGVGPTATKLLKASVIQVALPDLDRETKATIDRELAAEAQRAEEQKQAELENTKAGITSTTVGAKSTETSMELSRNEDRRKDEQHTRAMAEPSEAEGRESKSQEDRPKKRKRKVQYDQSTGTVTIEDQ